MLLATALAMLGAAGSAGALTKCNGGGGTNCNQVGWIDQEHCVNYNGMWYRMVHSYPDPEEWPARCEVWRGNISQMLVLRNGSGPYLSGYCTPDDEGPCC